MLYTIAVILLIAWLLGIVGTYAIGSFVHVLLVVAVVLFLVGLLSSKPWSRTTTGLALLVSLRTSSGTSSSM